MTGEDCREALKWSLVAAVIIALWCGAVAVRKGRAAMAHTPVHPGMELQDNSDRHMQHEELHPVWVIVVYEIEAQKLIGITEFVFASYQDCQSGAEQAKQESGLHLQPVCYLRWMKAETEAGK